MIWIRYIYSSYANIFNRYRIIKDGYIIMYKKIPTWQHKQKIITIPQQTSLTFSSHLYLQPIPPVQLTPIFINHDFQILTSSFHLSQYNLQPTFQHPHTKTQHKNTTLTNIHNLIQQQKIEQNEYTLVYNRMINKVIGLTMTIYACGTHNNKYWICYCDCGGRMRITKFNDNFWENIVKLSKNNSLQYKYERQQQIDTVVLPLPKYQQFLYYYNNMVFLTGNQCVWQWEITSKVWGFNLQQNRWMEFLEDVQSTQFKQQKIRQQKIRQDNEKTSKSKLKANQKNKSMEKDKIRQNQRYSSKNKDNKQKSKIKIKQKIKNLPQFQQKQKVTNKDNKNQWVLMIQNVLIFIGNNYIHFQLITNNKICGQIKKIQLTEDDSPLLSTQLDTFITCSYSLRNNSTNSPHLFILTKPQNPQKQPILLSFSLTTFLQYHNTSSHYNSNIHMHSFSHPQSLKSQQPKQFLKSTIVNSTDTPITQSKSLKIDQNLYINVVRYDLGVFLFHGIQNNLNLWKVVNEIVFMQIYSSVGEGGNFMQSMSLADGNFARKNQQNNFRSNNKNLILILYSKAKKSFQTNNFCMQMQTYSMKLHILQQINFKEASKPLSHYFQKKQYNDLLFLAQKRQVLCSRQLFEFYSSKFKKLYSNCSSSQQNQQQQTLVKLDHTKLSTIYFLVQHMFNNFTIELKGFDQDMLIDLMILSHKFQVSQMQMLCQQQIKFTITNFTKLYDYFRNAQTTHFREQYLKFFIIHAQDIIKTMPIGKVQQLIRLVYSPDCPHTNIIELKSKLQNNYSIKDTDNEQKQIHKSINYCNIIKNQQINIKICLKCHRLVTFNYENHRKNKSSFRDHSIGVKNKKKDNNSN